jgi:cytochrome c-type biogenesis protein
MENISLSFVFAFVAGLLSFLSPCVLPLVPVYLASLAGPEIFEAKASKRQITIFLHSLSFVLGFTTVFTIMGAGAGLAGLAIDTHLILIRNISGILLIAFGIFMLVALKIPRLNFEKRLTPTQSRTTSYLRSFLTGGIFCLAWTPCVGPILGGILTLAGSSATAWRGASMLAIYSLGLGIPFLIIGAAFDTITPLIKRIRRYSTTIYIISSAALITVGILILTNRLVLFMTTI